MLSTCPALVLTLFLASCSTAQPEAGQLAKDGSVPMSSAAQPTSDPATVVTGAITDLQLQQIIADYHTKVGSASKAGTPLPTVMPGYADAAMDQTDPSALTLNQLEWLLQSAILRYTTHADAVLSRLATLAELPTAEGARAAVVQLSIVSNVQRIDDREKIIAHTLGHPGMAAALRHGEAIDLFTAVQVTPREQWAFAAPYICKLADVIPDELPSERTWQVANLMEMVVLANVEVDPADREKLRTRTIEILEKAIARIDAEPEASRSESARSNRKRLDSARSYLNGAFVRGRLLNHPAPEMEFRWCSTEPRIASLADLRGKVVILDFWATWCGPCRILFPKLRDLAKHYEGYQVQILGVTHIQGFHIDSDHKRIDCKDDPEKELGLMPELVSGMNVTWPIVFTKDPRFSPDYGIRGIPTVTIIDSKGTVRHHGVSLNISMAEKCAMLDALLKEAGLSTPPPPPAEDPPAAPSPDGH